MRLGLALGYQGRGPDAGHVPLAREAERLGYDSVRTAESWGSDAFTPLTWIAAHTSRIRLGTAVAQTAARSPAATAMHALTLDHLSGGRVLLGLGLSGPQVVEADAFADGISLVGPRARVAERLELGRAGPVTDLLVLSPDPHTLRVPAELNG